MHLIGFPVIYNFLLVTVKITVVGYKWSEKQKKRPNEIEGKSQAMLASHGRLLLQLHQ